MESGVALAFQSPSYTLAEGEALAPCPHFQHLTSSLESSIPHDPEVEFVSTPGIL